MGGAERLDDNRRHAPRLVRNLKATCVDIVTRALGVEAAEIASFAVAHGKRLRLSDPVSFNEKIVWRKLYDRDVRLRMFADKLCAKEQVSRLVGNRYIIPTLAEATTLHELRPMGTGVVVKATHGSGMNAFVRTAGDWPSAQRAARWFLKTDYSRHANEWAYGLPPRLLVEPILPLGPDFKFHVFGGRVYMIQVDIDRFGRHRRAFYTPSWTKQRLTFGYPDAGHIDRPRTLAVMIELAQTLATGFSYVRVDLYEGPLFGEMTFYPEAGRAKFAPYEWDEIFGAQWAMLPPPAHASWPVDALRKQQDSAP